MDPTKRDEKFPVARVFCNPQLLDALQNSPFRTYDDSKTIVDMQLKLEPDDVCLLFQKLPCRPSREQYDEFVSQIFEFEKDSLRASLSHISPIDFTPEPPLFLNELPELKEQVIAFAADLKSRWKTLCRKFHSTKSAVVERTSFIPLPHQFFVPGGRFRECYYWDTLWIVKGLIASDMLHSAKLAVRNLFFLVDLVGFVPNGNRVYYLNRTQPPILTEAVKVIYDAIDDVIERVKWLKEAVPYLDKECLWFCKNRSLSSCYPGRAFEHRYLSIYSVSTSHARPESFKEDTESLRRRQKRCPSMVERDPTSVYKNLASAAESGWDFSSRWFPNNEERVPGSTQICNIVPVCLNSILLKAEKDLSCFHEILGNVDNEEKPSSGKLWNANEVDKKDYENTKNHYEFSSFYKKKARKREADMMELLWDQEKGLWFDYDLRTSSPSSVVSCAGLMPLWAGCNEDKWDHSYAKKIVEFVKGQSGLLQDGGLSCTTGISEEQWDFPNSWPPLIDIGVQGMTRLGEKYPTCQGKETAEIIAARFLETAFHGWRKDKNMHEKYDARHREGHRGVGGEYAPQVGFAWTNGAVLWLLREFSDALNKVVCV